MISIIKFIGGKVYFFLVELYFCFKTNIYADGIRVKPKTISKIEFKGNNSIGKDCRILITANNSSDKVFRLGKKSWLGNNVEINISGDSKVILGYYTTVQDFCKLLGNVYIGSNTLLAPSVFVSSGNHNAFLESYLTIREQDKKETISEQIFIEEDCWLGINSFIGRGTYIGRGSVIGAGAMVKGIIPPYSVVVGTNELKKKRYDFAPPAILKNEKKFTPYFYRGFHTYDDNLGLFLCYDEGTIVLKKEGNEDNIKIGLKLIDHSNKTREGYSFSIFCNGIKVDTSKTFNTENGMEVMITSEEEKVHDNNIFPLGLAAYNVLYIKLDPVSLNSNLAFFIEHCRVN